MVGRRFRCTDSTSADSFRRLEVIARIGRRRRWSDKNKAQIIAAAHV
jgi:hypothetical protein